MPPRRGLALVRCIRKFLFGIALSFMLAAVTNADSPNMEAVADAQCLVVGIRLASSQDQRLAQSGQMLLSYFLGRLDGRFPNANLLSLIRQEATRMSPTDFGEAARRCGLKFSERGAEIVQIGKSLSQPEK